MFAVGFCEGRDIQSKQTRAMATVLPKTCKDRGTIILRSEAHNYGYTFSKVLLEVRSFLVPRSIVKPGLEN